jgi:flagellar basal body P-ring protein FlgI
MHNTNSSSTIITRVEVKSKRLIGTSCYNFGIQLNSVAFDCIKRLIIAINGQFPSPTIQAIEGDTIVVRLKNNLSTKSMTLHWHVSIIVVHVFITTLCLFQLQNRGTKLPNLS